MTSRFAAVSAVAAILLSAGVARASSSIPADAEKVLETRVPATVACNLSQGTDVAALVQVPAEERGKVEAASCATDVAWPTTVDARYRR